MTSTIKRPRRTRAEMQAITTGLFEIAQEMHPVTVRQVFYQAETRGLIAKTEGEYKATVCRLLAKMRRQGIIPYSWISDNTRWMRKPRSYDSMEEALSITAQTYRRAPWSSAPVYVEVWLEKDALAGVLMEETEPYDVPLMVTKGYASLTYLEGAASEIRELRRPAYLYYFGDHDPSGVDITRAVEQGIREMAPGAEIHFERVAVTERQIHEWHLPTRPTKKKDTRSRNFHGESVELDAIPPRLLRALVRECIERHIDFRELDKLKQIEYEERETLRQVVKGWAANA